MEKRSTLRRFTDKLYGGINLTWPGIILYAVGTAVLTTVFLVLPIFHGTSFVRMGETLEAWIFFTVIIIANAKSPLDSALKTFVFFLISQPLIYPLLKKKHGRIRMVNFNVTVEITAGVM